MDKSLKQKILDWVIKKLEEELVIIISSAKEAHSSATDQEQVAENKYDTRSIEASYLAMGQSRRAGELEEKLVFLKKMSLHELSKDNSAQPTSLISVLIDDTEEKTFFLLPQTGGFKYLNPDTKNEVQVVSTASPIGQKLLNKKAGDFFEINLAKQVREYEVLRVS